MRMQVNPWPCSVGWGSGIAVSCSVGHRCGLDTSLLWLWHRLVVTAPIQPLAWEPPNAIGCSPKSKNKNLQRLFSDMRNGHHVSRKNELEFPGGAAG